MVITVGVVVPGYLGCLIPSLLAIACVSPQGRSANRSRMSIMDGLYSANRCTLYSCREM